MLIVSFYSKSTNAELIIRIRCLVTFERKGNVHIFFLLLRISILYYIDIGVGGPGGGNYNHNSGFFSSFFLKISDTFNPPSSQFTICFRRHRLKSLNNGSYNL